MIKISDPFIGKEEIEAARRVLQSGILSKGPEIKKFEDVFASYTGTDYAIATSNGTAALHAAMLASGIGKGDEVIVPAFSFVASANSVLYTGAKPVFVDVSAEDFNIDVRKIEEKITAKTRAIMPVHLYGQPCDMDKIIKICDSNGLALIEDACQAHGAEYKGKKAGSFGTGCFSFYATKNMTTGEGGMITTNDKKVAEKARIIINHGSAVNYDNKTLGYNFRMTEVQAAIGTVQLSRLDSLNKQRIENARTMASLLKKSDVEIPKTMPGRKHVFHQFTIRTKNRQSLIGKLEKNGIGYGIYYPKPIHKQELYTGLGYNDQLPVSEKLSEEVISLPVHPKVSDKNLDEVRVCVR